MRGDQPVVWSPSKNHAFGRKRKHKTSLHSREIAVASPMTLSCRRNSWVERQASLLDKTKIRGAIKQVHKSVKIQHLSDLFHIQIYLSIFHQRLRPWRTNFTTALRIESKRSSWPLRQSVHHCWKLHLVTLRPELFSTNEVLGLFNGICMKSMYIYSSYTLQGTNISPDKACLKMIFLFPR